MHYKTIRGHRSALRKAINERDARAKGLSKETIESHQPVAEVMIPKRLALALEEHVGQLEALERILTDQSFRDFIKHMRETLG